MQNVLQPDFCAVAQCNLHEGQSRTCPVNNNGAFLSTLGQYVRRDNSLALRLKLFLLRVSRRVYTV